MPWCGRPGPACLFLQLHSFSTRLLSCNTEACCPPPSCPHACTHTTFLSAKLCRGATCISGKSGTLSSWKPNGVPFHLLQVTQGPWTGDGCVVSRPAAGRSVFCGTGLLFVQIGVSSWLFPGSCSPRCGSLETACS